VGRDDPNRDDVDKYGGVSSRQITDQADVEAVVERVIAHARSLVGELQPLALCIDLVNDDGPSSLTEDLACLPAPWFDHAVASIFAVLMPHERRKRLGAYFTPPHVVCHLLERLMEFGVDPGADRIRDPAAGGAAFLVPLARIMVARWRKEGVSDVEIVTRLRDRLVGREIDPDLATLANSLLIRMLVREFSISRDQIGELALIEVGDSLELSPTTAPVADHEVGNPPFLRLANSDRTAAMKRFDDIASGRVNLYALFIRRGLEELPSGGILAYVVPSSFLGGPEFGKFRSRVSQLAEVLAIDIMEKRRALFLDAIQDTCFLLLRKREAPIMQPAAALAASDILLHDGTRTHGGTAEIGAGAAPWRLPGDDGDLSTTLAGWGYRGVIGYLVANRQSDRLYDEPEPGLLPLIWAKAITQAGFFDFDRGAAFKGKGWVSAPSDAPYVVHTGCVAVQRTSSRGQRRRISAAAISSEFVARHGGIVAENHVIILVPTSCDAAAPEDLAAALNTHCVSEALNRVCGSASISVRLLESIPLPVRCERPTT